MVTNRISPYRDYPDTSLGEDLLADVVHWRARGYSWDETAAKIEWDVNDLRRVCRHDPDYKPALKLAESEYWHESQGAGMRKLREQINDKDPKTATRAAQIVLNHMVELDTNKTKVQIERIRAEARIACAQAKGGQPVEENQERESDGGVPPKKLTAEEQEHPIFWTAEERAKFAVNADEAIARAADRWVDGRAEVYFWGGCHVLGRELEPDETDTPIYLSPDTSIPGRVIYWGIVKERLGGAHSDGPFLPPPGCKPPPVPIYTG
jgi:hypothetical protein